MVDLDSTLAEEFLDVAAGEPVSDVPAQGGSPRRCIDEWGCCNPAASVSAHGHRFRRPRLPARIGPMGFLKNRRRKRHAASTNWELVVPLMLLRHEVGLAEKAGVSEDQRRARASEISQAVVAEIGLEQVNEAFVACDYTTHYDLADEVQLVLTLGRIDRGDLLAPRALTRLGYNRVRAELFPESN
jgi:hypothetical protein